jgi:uncharacterized membrane protein YdcZ (DUF606 family)
MSITKLRGLLRLFRFELPFSAGICVILIVYGTAQLLNPHKAAGRRRYMRWIYMSGLLGMVLVLLVRLVGGGN